MNGTVQVPGILATTNLLSNIHANGSVVPPFPVPSADLSTGTATVPPIGTQPTMPKGQRHSAAWEEVNDCMGIIVGCFNDIQSKIGVPTAQKDIPDKSTKSEMLYIQGT